MKQFYFIFILFCSITPSVISQSVGTWKTYLAYYNTTAVAEANNHVFATANGSLYSYGKEDKSVNYYSKQTGLSDNDISCIAYNSSENRLVIVYSNGNIDLLGDKGIKNINYLKESNTQNKTVHSIYNYNEYSYLCGGFGIMVFDLKKEETKETYWFNGSVLSTVIHENTIYAVADNKLLQASLDDNLIDPNNWKSYVTNHTDIDNGSVQQICLFQNQLCILVGGKGIYYQSGDAYRQLLDKNNLRKMRAENDKLITFTNKTSGNDLYIYSSLTEYERTQVTNAVYDVSSLKDKNTFWFASADKGLTGIKKTGSNQYETIVSDLNTESPILNLNASLLMHKNKLYVGGGGRWGDRYNNPGTVMIYNTEDHSWFNFDQSKIASEATPKRFLDVTGIAVDPADESHLYVSTWGEGVYEFKDNELVTVHNLTNSLLETSNPDFIPNTYVRVGYPCFDKDNHLWMTNATSEPIKILKADGTWNKIGFTGIYSPSMPDKILIRDNGDKWVNFVRASNAGILVFNENGTIDNPSDDTSRFFTSLTDANMETIGETEYLCIVEDKNNSLWIGTNRGPVIVHNPSNVLTNINTHVSFNRIVRTDEEGSNYYFLTDERVNAIAVDEGNRKWIGTNSSGLFLVSEDGKENIEHFTTENSYLLSDNIQSIAIDHKTGEVFIGTEKGLVSYFGEAIRGSENYSDVYAYPNPVRPDFNQQVVITGLMENSNVKITDAKGNLIYQTKSVGGQATWDCRNRSGKRVASGVYLVLSATPEAKESVVTKIAVVK